MELTISIPSFDKKDDAERVLEILKSNNILGAEIKEKLISKEDGKVVPFKRVF